MSRYTSTLMDHFESPRNAGRLSLPCWVGESSLGGRAPRMKLYLRVEEGRVTAARFQTFGCGIAIACCSKLTEMATNRLVEECRGITPQQLEEGLGGLPAGKQFCAALAVEALRNGLNRMGRDGAADE